MWSLGWQSHQDDRNPFSRVPGTRGHTLHQLQATRHDAGVGGHHSRHLGGDGPNPPELLPRVGGWTGSRYPVGGSRHGHRDTSSDCTGLGGASPLCGPGVT